MVCLLHWSGWLVLGEGFWQCRAVCSSRWGSSSLGECRMIATSALSNQARCLQGLVIVRMQYKQTKLCWVWRSHQMHNASASIASCTGKLPLVPKLQTTRLFDCLISHTIYHYEANSLAQGPNCTQLMRTSRECNIHKAIDMQVTHSAGIGPIVLY